MKIDKYSAILGNTVGYHDMGDLTANRPLANLPFDGKYRLIDFQLSNLANAGIRSVYGIFRGQNIRSVFDHIRSGREWGLNTLLSHYFLGFHNADNDSETADRDYYEQVLTYLKRSGSDQTVYMGCDVLCNINLKQILHLHQANQNKLTVVYKNLPKEKLSAVNEILEIDESDTVIGTKDGSKAVADVEKMSTGIYIIDTLLLIEKLEEEMTKEAPRKLRSLLSQLIVDLGAFGYEYDGYVSNITSVKSYYDANMDMLDPEKFCSLLYSNQKVYTKIKNEESTYFDAKSKVTNSQFASGSVIEGEVDHSIISRSCRVAENATVKNAIIFPKVSIGEGATVEYAIIDKSVTIPAGVTIRGTLEKPLVVGKGQEITGDIIA